MKAITDICGGLRTVLAGMTALGAERYVQVLSDEQDKPIVVVVAERNPQRIAELQALAKKWDEEDAE